MTKRAEDFLVAVGAGHGLHTPGKRTPDGEREWSFNNKVVLALIDELHRLGLRTIRLDDPSGQRDVPLGERTRKANNAKADVLVSVHHNAFKGTWGGHTGTEVYSYPNSKKGAELAKKLQPELAKAYGLKNRGAKTANFHMLRESNMPAILTEGGYMDSTIDIVKMRDDEVLKQAGITIAKNVAEWLGVENKVNVQTTTKKPAEIKKQASESKKSVKQLADEVLASGKTGNQARADYLGLSLAEYEPIRQEINRRYGVKTAPVQPKKSVAQMAQEIIDGKHGTGEARKRALGSQYNAVQKRVNEILLGKSKPKPKSKSIDQLAREVIDGKHGTGDARKRALGSQYQAVQNRVNQILGAGNSSKKSIDTIAREVIDGKWGNDPERSRRLRNAGYDAAAVQRRVNQLL